MDPRLEARVRSLQYFPLEPDYRPPEDAEPAAFSVAPAVQFGLMQVIPGSGGMSFRLRPRDKPPRRKAFLKALAKIREYYKKK